MSNLVSFLRENWPDGLTLLEKTFFIRATRNKTFPNLILFKYNQLKSPMTNLIVQECRGIILDELQNWKIISYPYNKFFNMNETGKTTDIDWKNEVRAYEKIDGSLATLYYFEGVWQMATSGRPDGAGPVNSNSPYGSETETNDDQNQQIYVLISGEFHENEILTPVLSSGGDGHGQTRKSFSQLFWEVFNLLNYQLPSGEEDTHKCYMFELATLQNRIVIPYKEPKLYLHGVRNLIDLNEELPDSFCSKYGWELAPYKIIKGEKSEFDSQFVPSVNSLDGLKQEGYVICDAHFNRFKLKCPSYLRFHLLIPRGGSEFGWKRLVGIVQVNEGSEFLAYFPQWTDLYNQIYERYQVLVEGLQRTQEKYAHLEGRELYEEYKKLPAWMLQHLYSAKRFKVDFDFKEYFRDPLRYNSLCTLLNPSETIPEIPD